MAPAAQRQDLLIQWALDSKAAELTRSRAAASAWPAARALNPAPACRQRCCASVQGTPGSQLTVLRGQQSQRLNRTIYSPGTLPCCHLHPQGRATTQEVKTLATWLNCTFSPFPRSPSQWRADGPRSSHRPSQTETKARAGSCSSRTLSQRSCFTSDGERAAPGRDAAGSRSQEGIKQQVNFY